MEEMFQEAATEGMDVDPVSGNEIPEGVSGKNVRDDVDAKLSEGEFVIPAYAVKFFGVDFFEKLLKKAKKGQEELEEEGRSEGEGIEMAEGGLVPAALKDPTGADNLISKGNLTEVDSSGNTAKPQEFFVGGLVKKLIGGGSSGGGGSSSKNDDQRFGVGDYDPSNYKSTWNAADYGVGFSTAPGSSAPTPVSSVQCPEGFVLDKEKNVCVPKSQSKSNTSKPDAEQRTGGDRSGTTGNVDPKGKGSSGLGFGGDWTKDFDYSDTDKLVSETLSTLGVDEDGEIKSASEGRFGVGKGVAGNLTGGNVLAMGAAALNPALGLAVKGYQTGSAMSKASVANANALHLDSIGKKAEANRIREAAQAYAEDKGLTDRFGIKDDDYNGTARYAKALKEGLFGKPKTTSSVQIAKSSAPSSTANTVNERRGEGDGSSLNGGYNDGGFNNQGKSRAESGYSDSGDDDSDDGNAFAKGGLVTKRSKKTTSKKSKGKSKKGLGRKTK